MKEPEAVELLNPADGETASFYIKKREDIELFVSRVWGTLVGGSKVQDMTLVSKRLPGTADYYYDSWRTLRDYGIPVVPNLWIISSQEIMMTDLTAEHGALIYDKHAFSQSQRYPQYSRHLFNPFFLGVNLDEVRSATAAICKTAADHRVTLPLDDPFAMVVTPDRGWRMLILDLEQATFNGDTANRIRQMNHCYLELFMYWLGILQRYNKPSSNTLSVARN